MKKKWLAMLLSLAMVLTLLPTWAIAEDEPTGGQEPHYVASLTDRGNYTTIQDAIDATPDNLKLNIKLLDDVTENITVPANKIIVLNLDNKYTLNGNQTANTPTICNEGELTVKNGSVTRNGDGSSSHYIIENKGTMTLENLTVQGDASASLIRNNGEGASLIINSGVFTQTGDFIVLKNDLGSVTIKKGTFTTHSEKAVLNNWDTMTVEGGTFNGQILNGANDTENSVLTIAGGTFNSSKIRTYLGNGKKNAPIYITGGTFTDSNLTFTAEGQANVHQTHISAGTFAADPTADGGVASQNSDGTWTVQPYVAGVGGARYLSFDEAAAKANNEAITLFANAGTYTLDVGETLKVASNGYSITVKAPTAWVVGSTIDGDVTTYTTEEPTWKFTNAEGNDTYSASLPETVTASGTYELLKDATGDFRIAIDKKVIFASNPKVTFDLGGHNLTSLNKSENYGAVVTIDGSKAEVTMKNGTFAVPDGYSAFEIRGNCNVVLEDSLTVTTGTTGVVIGENGKLTTSANITTTGTNKAAISTNGNKTTAAAEIHVLGGTIASESVAIFQPAGTLNISGGTITGTTGVYVKSGTTNISGGTITGTGAQADYAYLGSGCQATGDALVIDNCGYPGGEPTVSITGGEFNSTNGVAVGAYYGNNETEIATITSTNHDLTVPAGYEWDDATNKLVKAATVVNVAKIGEVEYGTLQEALTAAAAATDSAKTVVLLSDVTESNGVSVAMATKNVILDLDGHVLTSDIEVTAPANSKLQFTIQNPVEQKDSGKLVGDITVTNGKLSIPRTTKQDVTVEGSITLENVADSSINGTVKQTNPDKAAITVNGTLAQNYVKIANTAVIDAAGVAIDVNAGAAKVLSDTGTSAAQVKGTITADTGADVIITGGVFSSDVGNYVADGYECVENDDVTYGFKVQKKVVNVAKIDAIEYASLADAIVAAQGDDAITLLDNVDLTSTGLRVEKDITLDLNGNNVKVGEHSNNNILVTGATLTLEDSAANSTGKIYTEEVYASGVNNGVIRVTENGEFIMNSGKIDVALENAAGDGQYAVVMGHDCTVTINGGEIKAGWYAISGNGNADRKNTAIVVNGGTLISTADYAIYNPSINSTVTINDGTIYGAAGGISMNRGTLTVKGGTITSKDQGSTGTWGDGTGGQGNAAINVYAKYDAASADISGGTITAEGNAIVIGEGDNSNGAVSVTGGTFSSDVSEYVADGYTCVKSDDDWKVNRAQVVEEIDKEEAAESTDITVQVGSEEATTVAAADDTAKAKAAEVIAEVTSNTAVANFTSNVVEVVGFGATLEIKPTALKLETATEETPVVTSISFNVTPKNSDGEEVENHNNLGTAVKFCLPVPAEWEGKQVKVLHGEESMGLFNVLGTGTACHVELESSSFSVYTVQTATDEEIGECVARVGDNYYTDIAEAIRAALAADAVLVLLKTVEFSEEEIGLSWPDQILKVDIKEDCEWCFEGTSPCIDMREVEGRTVELVVTKPAEKDVINVGDTFTVTPTLNVGNVDSIQLQLTYDKTRLEFVESEGWDVKNDQAVMYISWSPLSGTELPSVTFKALKADTTATSIASTNGIYTTAESTSSLYSGIANSSVDVSIESIVVDASALPATVEKVYNGEQQSAGITDAADVGYTVTTDAMGTNVGTYPVTLTLANENGNNKYAWPTGVEGLTVNGDVATYEVFTITPATVTVTPPTLASGLNYDGTEKNLIATNASAKLGEVDGNYGTFYYGVTDAGATEPTTDSSTATATAVDTYYVWYKFVPSANFTAENENVWLPAGSVEIGKGVIQDSWFTPPVVAENVHANGSEQNVLTALAETKNDVSPVELSFAYFLTTDNTYTAESIAEATVEWESVSTVADLTAKDADDYDIWLKVSGGDNYDPCYKKAGTFTILPGEYRTIVVEGYLPGATETESTAEVAAKNLVLVFAKGDLHFTYGGQAMYDVTGMQYKLYNTGSEAAPVYVLNGEEGQLVAGYSAHVYAYLTSDTKSDAESKVTITTNTTVAATIGITGGGIYDVSGDSKVLVNDAATVRDAANKGAKSTVVRSNLRADVDRNGAIDVNTDAEAIKQYILTQ